MTTEGYRLLLEYGNARSMRRWLVFEFWLYIAIALTIMICAEWVDEDGWDGVYVLTVAMLLFLALLSAITHRREVEKMADLQGEMARLALRRRTEVEERLRIEREKPRGGGYGPPAA